jgi:hypothetical protein
VRFLSTLLLCFILTVSSSYSYDTVDPNSSDDYESPTDYSDIEIDGLCFFGGWPSLMEDGKCKLPWDTSENPELKDVLRTYTKEYYCQSPNHIRCNPIIYGGEESAVAKMSSPYGNSLSNIRGHCVPYNVGEPEEEIFRKCEDATAEYKAAHKDKIWSEPDTVSEYEIYVSNIVKNCNAEDSNKLTCGHLYNRFNYLEGADNCSDQTALSMTPTAGNDWFRTVEKIANYSGTTRKLRYARDVASADKSALLDSRDSEDYPVGSDVGGEVAPSRAKPASSSSVSTKLTRPSDPVAAGYNLYGSDSKKFGTERTIWRVQEAGKVLASKGIVMDVGNISKSGGGTLPPHKSHRNGRDVDVRLVSSSGKSGPCNISKSCYSKEKTFEMVKAVLDVDPKGMRMIFINDPELRKMINRYAKEKYGLDDISRYCAGHDDHVHFSFKD